jgi:hypothetical protein
MKRGLVRILIAALVLFFAGCGGSADAPAKLSPEQLGELGARIYNNINDAPRFLSKTGISDEEFRRHIHQVSLDPAKSHRYREALELRLRHAG